MGALAASIVRWLFKSVLCVLFLSLIGNSLSARGFNPIRLVPGSERIHIEQKVVPLAATDAPIIVVVPVVTVSAQCPWPAPSRPPAQPSRAAAPVTSTTLPSVAQPATRSGHQPRDISLLPVEVGRWASSCWGDDSLG
jgi:hypothetical protein